jgi:hypothetical protein
MPLNKQKGNMYGFVTHTFNTIKGECPHGCTYCYMKRFGKQKPPHLDESEFKTDLGTGNYIFVGSSIDMFAESIDNSWVDKTLEYCRIFDNQYLFHTKNPKKLFHKYIFGETPIKSKFITTIETNRHYSQIMKYSPTPQIRANNANWGNQNDKMITIEPVMDFDIELFAEMIQRINPFQINIGADSGMNNLPEPSKDKLQIFISVLQGLGYNVHLKPNIGRLFK